MGAYANLGSEFVDFLGKKSNITANIIKNRLTETALDMTNIFQQTSSDCTNFNEVALYDCGVDDISILQKGMCKLNIKDRMSTSVQSSISQTADVKSKQFAKDIVQSIGINPGSQNATNVGQITDASTAKIKNRINQYCKNIATNVNTFTCQNVHGLHGDYVAQDSIVNSTVNCAMSADVVNDTTTQMSSISDQYASSTEQDALSTSVLGMFAIYIAWLINSILIGSQTINLILLFIVIGLICATAGIYWYFYHYKHNPRPFADRCADCTRFAKKDICEQSSCVWKGTDTQVVSDTEYPSLAPLCECDPTATDCSKQCYYFKTAEACYNANCGWDSTNDICTGHHSHCAVRSFGKEY